MWVLVFLLGLLAGMKDRRRMWLLGGAFVVTSALVYPHAALGGIVLLAFAVNAVEFLCSAGIPAVFMLDDLLVLVVALKTLEVSGPEWLAFG